MFATGTSFAGTAANVAATRNATGDVIVSVRARISRCGITASLDKPTFHVDGHAVTVKQATIAVACLRGVPHDAKREYHAEVNLGRLDAGDYTLHWSFPPVDAKLVVTAGEVRIPDEAAGG